MKMCPEMLNGWSIIFAQNKTRSETASASSVNECSLTIECPINLHSICTFYLLLFPRLPLPLQRLPLLSWPGPAHP